MIIEKKIYQAYYTNSSPITQYMVEQLQLNENDIVLEPCAGEGILVDSVLNLYPSIKMDVFELNPLSYQNLLMKYKFKENVTLYHKDTLLDTSLNLNSNFGGFYNKIIANPPYGAWQDETKKRQLKKIYPDFYVKETYGIFLYQSINLLKENGILSFIVPDTFLTLHMHKALRKAIIENTKILEISIFPSSFFPGVNFGYADLCIISLKKNNDKETCLSNKFNIRKGFQKVEELNHPSQSVELINFTQQEILNRDEYSFSTNSNKKVILIFKNSETTIDRIASCVTGFYSGNDKVFLKVLNKDIRNSKNYQLVDINKVASNINMETILDGLDGEQNFVPIVKGGAISTHKPNIWFMDWSKAAVSHYKTDKKSRFQNSSFYFKQGIGVPMVSASKISASMLDNRLFDQSIVGVFPNDEKYLYFLLAFFNSNVCNSLIRNINPSANNPANYIKRIPLILPSNSDLEEIHYLTMSLINNTKLKIVENNSVFEQELESIITKIFHQ